MSISGGYHNAPDAAGEMGMDCVQIFTKNNNQWRAKKLTDEDVELFKASVEKAGLSHTCSHSSYLINPASPDDELWQKSIAALTVEVDRAGALGCPGVVLHPGSPKDGDEDKGLTRVANGLDAAFEDAAEDAAEVWLEATAGQGKHLGYKFEHLAEIIDRADCADRLGVCIDTCHIFAAGYPIQTADEYAETMRQFGDTVGFGKLRALHLNDSKKPLGSRVDRHEHIGEGEIGEDAFAHVLTDPRLADVPMYLETPKDKDGTAMDPVNLATLRRLAGG
ncbi:MAG: deoxyribonuclease IV [Planctomycetota bacterium]